MDQKIVPETDNSEDHHKANDVQLMTEVLEQCRLNIGTSTRDMCISNCFFL